MGKALAWLLVALGGSAGGLLYAVQQKAGTGTPSQNGTAKPGQRANLDNIPSLAFSSVAAYHPPTVGPNGQPIQPGGATGGQTITSGPAKGGIVK